MEAEDPHSPPQDAPVKKQSPKKPVLHIARPILHESNLHENSKLSKSQKRQLQAVKRQRLKEKLTNPQTIKRRVKSFISGLFPFVSQLRRYRVAEYLPKDIVSGISVGMMLIPQAIAYASLAQLKPQNAFYSCFFGIVMYFFLGTSKHINMSNNGVISLLVGNVILSKAWKVVCEDSNSNDNVTLSSTISEYDATTSTYYYDPSTSTTSPGGGGSTQYGCVDPELAWAYGVTLTFLTGVLQTTFGLLRFGIFSIFLSDPLVNALTCGAAIHILESQIPAMLGMTKLKHASGTGQLIFNIMALFENIRDVNGVTIMLTSLCCFILIVGRKINEKILNYIPVPIPFDILVMIISLVISILADLEASFSVKVVGNIQRGFMSPTLPQWSIMPEMIVDAFTIAILSYSISVSVAKSYAVKYGYEVEANQELIANGGANIVIGLFNGFVSTASLGCTALNDCLGGKSQVHSLAAGLVVLLGIVAIGPVFHYVPQCALSAIILVNLFGTVLQVRNIVTLWELNKFDWVIWLVTLVGVVGLNVDIGLGIGLVFSLMTVIYRTHSAGAFLLGRLPGTDVYRNIDKNPSAQELPGLKIFKFEGNLYFGSAENFRKALYYKTKLNPKKLLSAKQKAKAAQRDFHDVGHINPVLEMSELSPEEEEVKGRTESICSQRQREMSIIGQEMKKIRADDAIIESENQKNVFTLQVPREEGFQSTNPPSDPRLTAGIAIARQADVLPVHYIVLDMSACAFIDSVGIRVLTQVIQDYDKVDIHLLLANVAGYVRKMLSNAGFHEKVPQCHAFVTVHDAVLSALHGIMEDYVDAEYSTPLGAGHRDLEDGSATLQLDYGRPSVSPTVSTAETKPSTPNLPTLHEENELPEVQKPCCSPSDAVFFSSTEKEHLMETIHQLVHHNRLLRRMLDREEEMGVPSISHHEQACQTDMELETESSLLFHSASVEWKGKSKGKRLSRLSAMLRRHSSKKSEDCLEENSSRQGGSDSFEPTELYDKHGDQNMLTESSHDVSLPQD